MLAGHSLIHDTGHCPWSGCDYRTGRVVQRPRQNSGSVGRKTEGRRRVVNGKQLLQITIPPHQFKNKTQQSNGNGWRAGLGSKWCGKVYVLCCVTESCVCFPLQGKSSIRKEGSRSALFPEKGGEENEGKIDCPFSLLTLLLCPNTFPFLSVCTKGEKACSFLLVLVSSVLRLRLVLIETFSFNKSRQPWGMHFQSFLLLLLLLSLRIWWKAGWNLISL